MKILVLFLDNSTTGVLMQILVLFLRQLHNRCFNANFSIVFKTTQQQVF